MSRDDHHGDTAVPLEGRILRDAQGKFIFIGDCAPLSFLQTVRHLITSAEVDSGASVQAARDPIIEITRPESEEQQQYPAIKLHEVESLAKEYITATSGLVELFEREELSGELKTWVNNQTSNSGDAAAAVFYLVLAIGAQERFEDKAEAWFKKARELLLKYMCSSMNVSTVQGFTLIAIFMLRASQPNGAYLYFCKKTTELSLPALELMNSSALAARTAYAIGIHRTEVNASFGEPARNSRDRIWKSLRVVDQLIRQVHTGWPLQ
jgi:hypothetical protein